ncbi:MAG: hypothetical protein IH876_06060 [Gemmatimonadetes bacterium]|nr:hypothetical protein [Gemmatimonadota bacterium]
MVHPSLGNAFFNNGDGSFKSGAYTSRSWDAGSGIGVSARVSTPIPGPQWQGASIQIGSVWNELKLPDWDRSTGSIP